jgi:probable O-glycosylation ligase (exosortase A-associated)
MRDMFFLALLPLLLYAMCKRPFIAVGMWIWTAMFFPNAWLYGVGSSIRYNLLFTGVAMVGYVAMKTKPKVQFGALGGLVLLFFVWTTLSSTMTSGLAGPTWELWGRFVKVILLFIFVILIFEKKLHFDFFLWCLVLSIGFYAGLEALKYLASGGGHMIQGFDGHVLGDRNELALAFVLILPICTYLLKEYGAKSQILRYGLLGLMCLIVVAVVGTQSRGGFVALIGLAGYLFVKSDHKVLLGAGTAVLVIVMMNFVSGEWMARMDSIGEAGEDASFMGRVIAWKLSFIMAMQHPFFGGGFKTLENSAVWFNLSQDFFSYPFFYTGDAVPNPNKARAAHSVYFQVLGDHGFAGLGIYLAMLASAFNNARKLARDARKVPEAAWIASMGTMCQLCIFAFCLGGAALSFAYFELMFAIYGLIVVLQLRILPAIVKRIAAQPAESVNPLVASGRPVLK